MFARDPLDVAPDAARPARAAWVLLATSIVFAAFAGVILERSIAAVHAAQEAARLQIEARRAQANIEATMRERANDPALREKMRAQQEVQRSLRMAWSNLFDSLEHAARKVDGRVTITSLAPVKGQGDGAQVNVVGLAFTSDVLLDYVEALQQEPHIKETVLTSQQLAQSGGTAVTRFHLSIIWEATP